MNMHSVHSALKAELSQKGIGQMRTSLQLVSIDRMSRFRETTIEIRIVNESNKDGILPAYLRIRDSILVELMTQLYVDRFQRDPNCLVSSRALPSRDALSAFHRKAERAYLKAAGPRLVWKAIRMALLKGVPGGNALSHLEIDLRRSADDKLSIVQGVPTPGDLERRSVVADWPPTLYDWGFPPVVRGAR